MASVFYRHDEGHTDGNDLNAVRQAGMSHPPQAMSIKMPMSPRAPSPLTPPATGDAKVVAHTSGDHGSALPIAARQSVSPCSQRFPIRDSPRNPFLLGGPADAGLYGPRRWNAQQRMASLPRRERGKMTYVFRGQRVTYADPYASSDSDEDDGQFGQPMKGRERTMDRLKPQVLFPRQSATKSNVSSSSSNSSSKKRTFSVSHNASERQQQSQPATYDQSKRRRYGNVSANNAALLDRLERAGWESDEDDAIVERQEECEEDEIDAALRARTLQQQDWQDSESEEDEAEVNPFLCTAAGPSDHR